MKLLYFAWVRQKIGRSEEDVTLPEDVHTICDLMVNLRGRGGGYAAAFDDPSRLRTARNQTHVQPDTQIADSDEIAFFPPVTGG
ncbi:MAG: molybdopterin converting factor subunit 1 [Rhizomicrobium sp.]|jgi:molybdopterin synthase sulfur carrier subunit